MNHKLTRILSLLLTCLLLASFAQPAFAAGSGRITHGTADTWITEDMLTTTPPGNYNIDKSVQADAMEGLYNAYFLEDKIQTVSIEIDENNLNYLLQNAADEPYVMTTSVTIGGTTLGYCGLRTKGNYTLAHAYSDNPSSDRFSFTVNFGKYINKENGFDKKQNFYGCDKISFNNFFFDKSMMKEFFALKLMDEMGLPTPQYGLAKLYINGQYYGVFAMIENLDKPIIEQYYQLESQDVSNYLCKPTATNLLYNQIAENDSPLWEHDEEKRLEVEDMLPTATEWVRKLNCLSSGTDFAGNAIDVNSEEYLQLLGQVMNVDAAVRYFAAHSWLCQMDNMFTERQNFGLYIDATGKATIVPWDYDLSFGCYYPSTAETTANYNIDVMFKIDPQIQGDTSATCARIYAGYPLFNVIYQNDALMEQYHAYMLDCSRIAALGGTAQATGKAYDPGFFSSFIERMEETVIEAATEELADNVYYMNRIDQPRDVKEALPNLAKMIALRSVGVYVQVDGIETTVTASGCDLETLGNGARGESSNEGILTIVDAATGIFATAEFEGGRRKPAPVLNITKPDDSDVTYREIRDAVALERGDTLLVYESTNIVRPVSDYTLTIPMAQEHLAEGTEYAFYAYSGGTLTPLEMTRDDNLFTGITSSIDCIAVVVKPAVTPLSLPVIPIVIALAVIAAAAVTMMILRRKKAAQ